MTETISNAIAEPGPDQQEIEARLTRSVVNSFDDCDNPRLKFVMQALVRHAHAFVREVRLSEEEWNTAIEFLTDVGHITDDRRQEFILLSDILGISMQTINVNHETYEMPRKQRYSVPSS